MDNEKELTKEELGNKIATIQKVIENDTVGNGLVILSATLDLTIRNISYKELIHT